MTVAMTERELQKQIKKTPVMSSIVFQDQIKIGVTRIDPNIITFIHYKINGAHREDSYSFIILDLMEDLKDFEKKILFIKHKGSYSK